MLLCLIKDVKNIIKIILILGICILLAGCVDTTPTHRNLGESSKLCSKNIWMHTHNPHRFNGPIYNNEFPCVKVTGLVIKVESEETDGDYVFTLKMQKTSIEVEIVCVYAPHNFTSATEACKNYKNDVLLPNLYDKIEVIGYWVIDTNHKNQQEIHPASVINKL